MQRSHWLTSRIATTDKASPEEKETAHKKFQEVAFAYAILSDEKRRKRYDLTGNTAETLEGEDGEFSWTDFYREQYSTAVDASAIEKVKSEYQGSEEERRDILAAYEMHEGDMDGVFEEVMLSSVLDDEERFREVIEKAIKDGEVEDYEKFSGEGVKQRKRRVAKAKEEAKEAMEMARELGVEDKLFGNGEGGKGKKKNKGGKADGEDELMALIQQRQKSRAEDFFAGLEAKYAPKSKAKRGVDNDGEKNGGGAKKQKRKR